MPPKRLTEGGLTAKASGLSAKAGGPDTDIFTTGQLAELFRVAPRTLSKWVDAGRLKGYRLPGSNDRRIYRQDALEFARAAGMDRIAAAIDVRPHLVAFGVRGRALAAIAALFDACKCEAARSPGMAAVAVSRLARPVLVVDFQEGAAECRQLAEDARTVNRHAACYAVAADDTVLSAYAGSFAGIVRPGELHLLVADIRAAL